jgi:hypothetical protein
VAEIALKANVTTMGPLAVVAISATNSLPVPVNVSFSLDADLKVNGNDSVRCYMFDSGRGFYMPSGSVTLNITTKGHPLGVDADTFWYGYFGSRTSNQWRQVSSESYSGDSGMVLAWQNRVVPAQGKMVVAVVLRWDSETSPPVLGISSMSIPSRLHRSSIITFHGTVSDVWNERISVYIVIDNDYTFFYPVAIDLVSGDSFDAAFALIDWEIELGVHAFTVYAIDSSGTVCRDPPSYSIDLIAAPRTAAPTLPAPPNCRLLHMRKEESQLLDGVLNPDDDTPTPHFVLYGQSLCQPSSTVYLSFSGFETIVAVEEERERVIGLAPVKFVNSGIIVRTFVHVAGPCAIIAFRITNIDLVNHAVSISLNSTLDTSGDLIDLELSELANGKGFAAIASRVRANFLCRHFPFTTDATGYSFGSSSQTDDPSSVKIWWENESISASSEIVLSTVISWGEPSEPPTIQVSPLEIANETIAVHGTIESSATGSASILIVLDDDYSRLRTIGWFSVGSDFSDVMAFTSYGVSTTPRSVIVYAIDDNGAISGPYRQPLQRTPSFTPSISYSSRKRTHMIILIYSLFFPVF